MAKTTVPPADGVDQTYVAAGVQAMTWVQDIGKTEAGCATHPAAADQTARCRRQVHALAVRAARNATMAVHYRASSPNLVIFQVVLILDSCDAVSQAVGDGTA